MIKTRSKRLTEFPDYEIDEYGNVTSHKRKSPLRMSPKRGKDGYLTIGLRRGGKKYFRSIHRLVAQTFINNPLNKDQVNHIDGNIYNNHIGNLEWCTLQENIAHSFHTLGRKGQHTTSKKCILLRNNEIVSDFNDIKSACKYAAKEFSASYYGLYKYYISNKCSISVIE